MSIVGGVNVVVKDSDSLPIIRGTVGALGRCNIPCRIRIFSTREAPLRTGRFSSSTVGGNFNTVVTTTKVTTRLTNTVTTGAALPIINVPMGSTDLSNISTLLSAIRVPPNVLITAINVGNTIGTTLLYVRVLTMGSRDLTGGLSSTELTTTGGILRGGGTIRRGCGG